MDIWLEIIDIKFGPVLIHITPVLCGINQIIIKSSINQQFGAVSLLSDTNGVIIGSIVIS